MFYIYIASLIIGGGIISYSLMFGDTDTDGFDSQHSDMDTSGPLGFLSLRNVIFFLTFFGLTGSLLDFFDFFGFVAFFIALIVGIGAGYSNHKLYKYLIATESGDPTDLRDLIGKPARVKLPISKNRKGMLVLESGGRTIDIIAMIDESSDSEKIEQGQEVLITNFDNNIAYVAAKNDF